MISETIMEQCLGKKIKITYNDQSSEETFVNNLLKFKTGRINRKLRYT